MGNTREEDNIREERPQEEKILKDHDIKKKWFPQETQCIITRKNVSDKWQVILTFFRGLSQAIHEPDEKASWNVTATAVYSPHPHHPTRLQLLQYYSSSLDTKLCL